MAEKTTLIDPFAEVNALAEKYGIDYDCTDPDWPEFFEKDVEEAEIADQIQEVADALGDVGAYDAQYAVESGWVSPNHPAVVGLLPDNEATGQEWSMSSFTDAENDEARRHVTGSQAARVAMAA